MPGHREVDSDGRYEDEYEGYDDYEEEDEEEEEEEEEEAQPNPEEQKFLELRERLKDQIRNKLRKNNAKDLGPTGPAQTKKKPTTNDKFGSFFGPSKPVIAQRVLEAKLSLEQTQHITSNASNFSSGKKKTPFSTSVESKLRSDRQHPKPINEMKKKAQTLKDMRDYSFLLSDDADFPDSVKEQPPAPRKVPVQNSDARVGHPSAKSTRPSSNHPLSSSHVKRSTSLPSSSHNKKGIGISSSSYDKKSPITINRPMQRKIIPPKEDSLSKPKAAPGKLPGGSLGNGPGRPVGHSKPLPSRPSIQSNNLNKLSTKVQSNHTLKNKSSSLKPQSSIQNRPVEHKKLPVEHKKLPQGSEKARPSSREPIPSSRSQPSKQIPQHRSSDNRPKKRPVPNSFEEEEDPLQMIRNMFGYNPNKWAGRDDDDSDMEVGFDVIQKEERRSSKIARKEDEEQLRLIEEEEKRERERKKKKQRMP